MEDLRWRYPEANLVMAAVDSATVIEINDLVYQDTDDAKPASMIPVCRLPDASRIRAEIPGEIAQRNFAKQFLGVAMEASRSGDTDPIQVATTGVFKFDCPIGTFELGDLMGVGEASSGTAIEDQQVAPVNDAKRAIARVAKRAALVATSVLVDIRSTVMAGGIISRG